MGTAGPGKGKTALDLAVGNHKEETAAYLRDDLGALRAAQVRQRRKEVLDKARAEAIGGENFHKITASLVRGLRFGGGVGAEHHRPVMRMRRGHQLGLGDGAHDKFRARLAGGMAGGHVQHRANADDGALA